MIYLWYKLWATGSYLWAGVLERNPHFQDDCDAWYEAGDYFYVRARAVRVRSSKAARSFLIYPAGTGSHKNDSVASEAPQDVLAGITDL